MELPPLAVRLLATLAYCDQFAYPLTKEELNRRLIAGRGGRAANAVEFDQALATLVAQGRVGVRHPFYFLKGSEQTVDIRLERSKYSPHKWAEAQRVAHTLSWLPWIRAVAITGSLAMNNTVADDDSDFMIITETNRLWATRPLVIAYAWWKGKRRSWQREEKNSWCFNLWLEEDALHSPGLHPSLYAAYEVCQARFVLSRNQVEQRFMAQNHWVACYIPMFFSDRYREAKVDTSIKNEMVGYSLLHMLDTCIAWGWTVYNEVAFWAQWVYMVRHRTREKVTRSVAFFHPRDTKKLVHHRWKTTVAKVSQLQ